MPEFVSSVWRDGIFKDRVVFCTGGNGTICSNQVRAMVYLGANAMIIGRNASKTEEMAKSIASVRHGSKVIGLGNIDVRDISLLQKAADQCATELGGIDFVIAGAAGNFFAPISSLSANAFKSVMDIDVLGSYNTVKATVPHLVTSATRHKGSPIPSARIIFISATFHYTGYPLQTHVAVAKAGVDALSANVAIEYGPLGVTSNVITPGPISGTEGMARLTHQGTSEEGEAKGIPLQRYGTVKEIADATVYLFGDAGNYVNGAVVVVDGGSWRTSGPGPRTKGAVGYPELVTGGFVRGKL